MKILIVAAHPLKHSLCAAFTDQIAETLIDMGHDVVIEDLYDNRFDPVLSAGERQSYYRASFDMAAVENEILHLLNAEALVLIFPTWWFGFPAILKGWFDRVWAPTVAYDHACDFGPIKPRLKGLRKAYVVTTLGAPWWVDYFILRRPLKRTIQFALLGACTRKCQLTYRSFYKCENVSPERMEAFSRKIESDLNTIF
jgi:putative NADPH-quinone reductase